MFHSLSVGTFINALVSLIVTMLKNDKKK
ncbi:putative holin-like toxin [Enterococcus hirae]|nr:putative holin-like toxin [Listeria monocytogenes]EMF0260900.1 putative holin-like toxin [Enterococcus hirae]KAB5920674.1 putative holin-like toxin [Bifidobacterium adolescentis]EMF0287163.1 putative holin-like toxin [Enterococcus hirae]QKX72489.1 putative holin-like toxin [Enterococcus hirae]